MTRSEVIPGAVPLVNNSPQKPPLGLRTERISGSSFVAPREQNYQTWLYRLRSSLIHTDFEPLNEVDPAAAGHGYGVPSPTSLEHVSPNSSFWPTLPVPARADWTAGQQLVGRTGDPQRKEGMAVWVFSVTEDMPARQAFSSLDGDMLIVPQAGTLDVQTELGRLLVRQSEIALVPRSMRFRITLPGGKPARGYICELYQGHFRLPDLGVLGSTGLANVRDFQIPVAAVDDAVLRHIQNGATKAREEEEEEEWTIVSRLMGRLWRCRQANTPFDVAGWHGTCYPYKYDLGRFSAFGNVAFDENDPCLFTVLTARHHGAEPSTAVVDFAVIPPRWKTSLDTLWVPYYHRNTMQEFYAPIVSTQDPEHPLNKAAKGNRFAPFAAGLHSCMATHGPSEAEFQAARARDTSKPELVQSDGVVVILLETERPMVLSDWAAGCAQLNTQKVREKV